MDAPFGRLGIVGLGFIGGSVALATRRRWPALPITVCDPATITQEAVTQGLITSTVSAPAGLKDCDLVVIATPVQLVAGVMAQLAEAGITGVVTDTSSTKRVVMSAARATPQLHFVGGNPMASAATSGLAAARADVFDGRPWLLVSSRPDADDVRDAMLATFIVGLGAAPEWTDAVTHDRVMAHVSQAPHLVSSVLTATSGATVSTTDVWEGTLDTNADFIADAIMAIAAKLPTSAASLTDAPAVRDLFERAEALKASR